METIAQARSTTYSILSSSILHAGLVVGVLAMNIALPVITPKETVQIEILGDNSAALAAQADASTVQKQQEIKQEPVLPKEQAAPTVAKALPAKAHVAKTSKSSPIVTPVPVVVNSAPVADESENLEPETVTTTAVPELDSAAVDEDLERANQDAAEAVQAKAALSEVDNVIDESEVLAAKAREEEQARSAILEKEAASRRAREKAALEKTRQAQIAAMTAEKARMKAEAEERARARAEAQSQEAREAEEKFQKARAAAIAATAEAAGQADAAMAEGDAATQGAENSVENATAAALAGEKARQAQAAQAAADARAAQQAATAAAATTQKIRALEELRQMPGNKPPFYEEDDRLAGRQGSVIFHAFITKDGAPSEIKLMQSSGYKNLDLKTLKAIRAWRFYPGQEGWVEIPFRWDLKGEPQLIRGTLRKVSQK